MQRTGDDFLAGTGFAQQQHRQFIGQTLAGHAQGPGITDVTAGQGFEVRLRFGDLGGGARGRADVDRALRRAQGLVEEFAFGGLQTADPALVQA
ncbi:hypothetical protein D3C81_1989150 [compost metagenome]